METKFKIGDRVRCVASTTGDYVGAGWRYGNEFNIDRITHNNIAWDIDENRGGVYFHALELATENKSITNNNIQMKYFKTKEILNRSITVCVVVEGDKVNTGYNIRFLTDVEDPERTKTISYGRAMKEKTNLTTGLTITKGLTEKYILAAIANKVLADIENGTIVIKGIR